MKIACAQLNCEPANPKQNINRITTFCQQAKEANVDLVVFPELSDVGYAFDKLNDVASTWQDYPATSLQRLAEQLELNIISGLTEKTENGIYNSAIVINKNGRIVAHYRKAHLFVHGEIDESARFLAGESLCQFELEGLKFGIAICYDLRFPEMFRRLSLMGAEIIILPSAWPFPREEHFKALVKARAIENQVYMVACNRVGQDHDVVFSGNSRIIAPNGRIEVAANDNEEDLIAVNIDQHLIESVREAMPVWQHRRPDLY